MWQDLYFFVCCLSVSVGFLLISFSFCFFAYSSSGVFLSVSVPFRHVSAELCFQLSKVVPYSTPFSIFNTSAYIAHVVFRITIPADSSPILNPFFLR